MHAKYAGSIFASIAMYLHMRPCTIVQGARVIQGVQKEKWIGWWNNKDESMASTG